MVNAERESYLRHWATDMEELFIAWVNMAVLVISALLFLYFYVRNVSPAALEKKIGDIAYPKCKRYRQIAGFLT